MKTKFEILKSLMEKNEKVILDFFESGMIGISEYKCDDNFPDNDYRLGRIKDLSPELICLERYERTPKSQMIYIDLNHIQSIFL